MPVNETTTNLYLQLGIAGATLFILLVFTILLFRFVSENKRNKALDSGSKIDKLCDKIDLLITSNADYSKELNRVLLSNDKDQKETLNILNNILEAVLDSQRRIVRVDDRTYKCLGNPKEGKEE